MLTFLLIRTCWLTHVLIKMRAASNEEEICGSTQYTQFALINKIRARAIIVQEKFSFCHNLLMKSAMSVESPANRNSAANYNFFPPYFVGLTYKKVRNGNLSIKSV